MDKIIKKKYRTSLRKDLVLKLIEEEAGYAIPDLAKRIFGENDYFACQQIGQILSSLRKEGIPAYPRHKGEEVIIPRTLADYRDIIQHIFEEGGLPTRSLRALNLLIESALKYPRLIKENRKRLNTLEKPITGTRKELKRLAKR